MNFQDCRIPTNFRMPEGYKRKFVFLGKSVRLEITASPPMAILLKTIPLEREPCHPDMGNSLDWIQESVERMRAENEP